MERTTPQRATIDIDATVTTYLSIDRQVLAIHALSGCDTVVYMWGICNASVVKQLLKGLKLK